MQHIRYNPQNDIDMSNGRGSREDMIEGGDFILNLPTDKSQPSHTEIKLVESIFKEDTKSMKNVVSEMKDLLIIGLLFFIFSLPQTTLMLERLSPVINRSIYISIGVRAFIVMVLYWLIKHFYFSRR